MKLRRFVPVLVLVGMTVPLFAQGGGRGSTEATINGKKVAIEYGVPKLGGRDMVGKMTVGTTWRVGKDRATHIDTAGDLIINGKELKAGKYTLWVKKTGADSWVLAFHPKTGVWGAPPLTDGYAAELPLTMSKSAESADDLKIMLGEDKGKGKIKIHWGTAVLAGSFGVK